MTSGFPSTSIAFERVAVDRGTRTLFSDISFSLSGSELIWIQGENGVGKTTLLRLASGLTKPSGGHIHWHCNGSPCRAADIMTYQSHANATKKQLSVSEDLSFWSRLSGSKAAIKPILERVGLTVQANLRCHLLSAGQKRRLAIARLLVSQKPVWLMDEPAAAMDVSGQALIEDVINTHILDGGAVLTASHDTIKKFKGRTSVLRLSNS